MLFLAHLLNGIANILNMMLSMVIFFVVIRALISWVNPDPYNPIVRFLYAFTDPMLNQIRRRLPMFGGGIDLSPSVLILALYLLQYTVVPLLQDYAMELRRSVLTTTL